ncbi:MAG: SusC/RagA family TonB-linked outer membrane protein [Chitinophagaceae bacterium]
MRKLASLCAVLMLFSAFAFAQKTVTGQVKDSKGDPVPFATITVKGSNTGASADANGNFSIQVKEGETLVISSASFAEQQIKVGAPSAVAVILQPQGNLQEIVVTAYGIRKSRNQVTYAAQQVAGDEVSKNRSSNFIQNLSGKVSGVEFRQSNTLGGSTNVVVRGVKSISGNNQALFVVDGMPMDNTNAKSISPTTGVAQQSVGRGGYDYGSAAADINPDDIESITVLKGAAATALYGSQGGNGVILITTKKGARGLGITVNSGVSVGKYDKSTFLKYQQEYGGGYGAYYEDPSGFFLYRDIDGDGTDDLVMTTSEDASYGGKLDGRLVYQWDAFDPLSPNFGKSRPWLPAANQPGSIFQTAVSSNQSVAIAGSSDMGSFKLGYTRTDDKGIMPNSKIAKNLVNFGGTYNLTSKLTAGASVNFSGINGKGRYGTGYDDKNLMGNFRQWWQVNVDVKEQKEAYEREKRNVTWNWADPTDLSPIYWDNPYFTRYENFETDARTRYFGNASLNYKPVSWLNILGRVSHDTYSEIQEERQAVGSVTTSSYTRTNRNVSGTNFDLLMNMEKELTKDITLRGLLGTNVRKERRELIVASTNGGLVANRIYSLSNSLNPINAPVEIDQRREVWGNFAGATISWKDMITVDGTIRNDQSSTLPKGANSYWYPSASLGWVFSKLIPSTTWLSYGKFRANYAQVGNDALPYSLVDAYAIGTPFGSNSQASVAGTSANSALKPERTKSYEFGLEVALIKNRFGFDVSYYNAKTFDQIFAVPISTATGYNSRFLNAGNVRNKGVELSVFGSPIQTKDFTWTINLNWTRNRNKVEELFPGIDVITLGTFQGGVSINAALGEPFGIIRGNDYVYANNDKGSGQRTVGATGRPLLTVESNKNIGDVNPDWIGGVNNTLKYKDFSLSWLIDVRQGGDLFSLDLYYGLATGLYPETAGLNDLGNPSRNTIADGGGIIHPGVKQDGTPNDIRVSNTNYGSYGYARNPAAGFIYDASYVKLREAILTYTLPKTLMGRLNPFKGIDLSLIGRNLWIIHKNLPYADPEENVSAGNLQGYQSGAYPSVRTLAFNVKFRF